MIEKLNTEYILKRDNFDKEQSIKWLNVDIKDIVDKINEIIDRLNKE